MTSYSFLEQCVGMLFVGKNVLIYDTFSLGVVSIYLIKAASSAVPYAMQCLRFKFLLESNLFFSLQMLLQHIL